MLDVDINREIEDEADEYNIENDCSRWIPLSNKEEKKQNCRNPRVAIQISKNPENIRGGQIPTF